MIYRDSEAGLSLVGYTLLVALLCLAVVAAVTATGDSTEAAFCRSSSALNGGDGSECDDAGGCGP